MGKLVITTRRWTEYLHEIKGLQVVQPIPRLDCGHFRGGPGLTAYYAIKEVAAARREKIDD